MNTINGTKIKYLVERVPRGTLVLSSYLKDLGISNDLQQAYVKNGWLKRVDRGVFVFFSDEPTLEGALSCLSTQSNLEIHLGGLSALRLQGYHHFIQRDGNSIVEYVYKSSQERLPAWFNASNLQRNMEIVSTSFLGGGFALENQKHRDYEYPIASAERAILEYLFLCPERGSLKVAYQMLEMMVGLRPDSLQTLLEHCSSVKVKRLFLYMAEKLGHTWFDYLDVARIDLGKGKRVIEPNGVYDSKYRISLRDVENV
jgi:hypothetical protein